MTDHIAHVPTEIPLRYKPPSTAGRLLKYTLVRGLSLMAVVVVSVFLTVFIASRSAVIDDDISLAPPGSNPSPIKGWFSGISNPIIRHQPEAASESGSWLQTAVRLTYHGITLNLGRTQVLYMQSGRTYAFVKDAILDSLPRTLLLFGSANLLIFFTSLWMARLTTRHFGSWLDRIIVGISPLSSIPPWIYGLLINLFIFKVLRTYIGGMVDAWPEEFTWSYLPVLLKFIGPPILAIFLSKFFMSVYTWRSFLLVFANEDYIELARAKGLPSKVLERSYLIRPVLPNLITSFTMMLIAIWQEAIIVELFFNVSGIGHVFYNAIRYKDMPLIVGLTVIFAYMLAASVFILDLVYGIVDPRVNVGENRKAGRAVRARSGGLIGRLRRMANSVKTSPNWNSIRNGRVPGSWIGQHPQRVRQALPMREQIRSVFENLREALAPGREVLRVPSAVAGLVFILGLFAASVYAIIFLPYPDAVRQWNSDRRSWANNPQLASPVWLNYFRSKKLPPNIQLAGGSAGVTKTRTVLSEEMTEVVISFPFSYPYQGFPQDMHLNIRSDYESKFPFLSLEWYTPDGRQIDAGDFNVRRRSDRYTLAENSRLVRRLKGVHPNVGLFADPDQDTATAVPGQYELRVVALVFEPQADVEVDFHLFGQVYGPAGTDHMRRDLSLALLWGTPVALAFGLAGAMGTSLATMTIAAISAWYGGWVDGLIQRMTEVNMILPAFPILLIVYNFYSKSVWMILGVAVLLGIFGSAIKTHRAIFLQIKEAPYVEAARSYGSSDMRIIFSYLAPRILPVVIPQLVVLIPTYVYLEASLAFLNMSDPLMPTWGKVMREAILNGGLEGAFHWLVIPSGILILTGFAFLLVGYALEKALNPHLRGV